MDRIYDILRGIEESIKPAQSTLLPVPTTDIGPAPDPNNKPPIKPELVDQTTIDDSEKQQKDKVQQLQVKNPNEQVSRPNGDQSIAMSQFKVGDRVKNIDQACVHAGSEGVVQNIEEDPVSKKNSVGYNTTNAGQSWTVDQYLRKHEDQLALIDSKDDNGLTAGTKPNLNDYDIENAEIDKLKKKLNEIKKSKGLELSDLLDNDEDLMEELLEYKNELYEMSVASLRSIVNLLQHLMNSLENEHVKENLTESWLQGKIALAEDYVTTIHNFVMYSRSETDSEDTDAASKSRPGLWENIRKKKEREGKDYKPAKPGDKDRPDSKTWKKLTKDSKKSE